VVFIDWLPDPPPMMVAWLSFDEPRVSLPVPPMRVTLEPPWS